MRLEVDNVVYGTAELVITRSEVIHNIINRIEFEDFKILDSYKELAYSKLDSLRPLLEDKITPCPLTNLLLGATYRLIYVTIKEGYFNTAVYGRDDRSPTVFVEELKNAANCIMSVTRYSDSEDQKREFYKALQTSVNALDELAVILMGLEDQVKRTA